MGGLLWGGLTTNQAVAATIQYSFTGTVSHVHNLLNPPFSVDAGNPSAMSGSMTVNTLDLDTNPNGRFGQYTIEAFSVKIFPYSGTPTPYTIGMVSTPGSFNQVQIRNGSPGQDQFNVDVIPTLGASVGTMQPTKFDIQLHGPSSIFGSDALPATSPSISAFTNRNIWRLIFEPGTGKLVSGTITSLTAVPLPAAVILFGAGLIALVALGAGSWRKRNNSLA